MKAKFNHGSPTTDNNKFSGRGSSERHDVISIMGSHQLTIKGCADGKLKGGT